MARPIRSWCSASTRPLRTSSRCSSARWKAITRESSALDPSGKFLLIANQKSNEIVVVERDPKTGLLGKTVQKLPIDAPGDLQVLVRQ